MYTKYDSCLAGETARRGEALLIPEYIYCVSCMTSSETVVARRIEETFHVRIIYLSYDREEKKSGTWTIVTHPVHFGYVFVYTDQPINPLRICDIENVNRVLQYGDGEINLTGEDRFFAEWILRCDGHIGLSRALLVGDETRIIDGPLKDYEGTIRRIDRHKRRAWVDVMVGDEVKSIQMYFEWLTVQDGNLIRLRDSRDYLQNKG